MRRFFKEGLLIKKFGMRGQAGTQPLATSTCHLDLPSASPPAWRSCTSDGSGRRTLRRNERRRNASATLHCNGITATAGRAAAASVVGGRQRNSERSTGLARVVVGGSWAGGVLRRSGDGGSSSMQRAIPTGSTVDRQRRDGRQRDGQRAGGEACHA